MRVAASIHAMPQFRLQQINRFLYCNIPWGEAISMPSNVCNSNDWNDNIQRIWLLFLCLVVTQVISTETMPIANGFIQLVWLVCLIAIVATSKHNAKGITANTKYHISNLMTAVFIDYLFVLAGCYGTVYFFLLLLRQFCFPISLVPIKR